MTTTYLYIERMLDDNAIEVVRELLTGIGFRPITITEGEVKLGWDRLSHKDFELIKEQLHNQGFELTSVSQTTFVDRAEGVNIL